MLKRLIIDRLDNGYSLYGRNERFEPIIESVAVTEEEVVAIVREALKQEIVKR